MGSGKENGEGRGRGEVSIQATWDRSGRELHYTQTRDSKEGKGSLILLKVAGVLKLKSY